MKLVMTRQASERLPVQGRDGHLVGFVQDPLVLGFETDESDRAMLPAGTVLRVLGPQFPGDTMLRLEAMVDPAPKPR